MEQGGVRHIAHRGVRDQGSGGGQHRHGHRQVRCDNGSEKKPFVRNYDMSLKDILKKFDIIR